MHVRKVLESNDDYMDTFFVDYVDMGWDPSGDNLEEEFMASFDLFYSTVSDAINFSDGRINAVILAKGDVTIKYGLGVKVRTREQLVKMVTDIMFPDMSEQLKLFIKLRS